MSRYRKHVKECQTWLLKNVYISLYTLIAAGIYNTSNFIHSSFHCVVIYTSFPVKTAICRNNKTTIYLLYLVILRLPRRIKLNAFYILYVYYPNFASFICLFILRKSHIKGAIGYNIAVYSNKMFHRIRINVASLEYSVLYSLHRRQ